MKVHQRTMTGGGNLIKTILKNIIKRGFLFILVFLILFAALRPQEVLALWLFDSKGPKVPQGLQASKVDITKTQATLDTPTEATMPVKKVDHTPVREDKSKRTAFTSTYVNKDGTKTLKYTPDQQNYQQNGTWQKIDNTLEAVTSQAPTQNILEVIGGNGSKVGAPSSFKGKAGTVKTEMRSLSDGLKIEAPGRTLVMKPVGARNVKPEKKDDRTVVYKDAWKDVDLEYQLRGETVKEVVVVKSQAAPSTFDFTVEGGTVIKHPTRAGELAIEGLPDDFSFSALTLDVNGRGVISEQHVTQSPTNKGIKVELDKAWMKAQPNSSFPMRIDPSFGRFMTSWWMFKSDGFACGASNCYANTGTLYDNGWKSWRTYFQFPYPELAGKRVLGANLHGWFQPGINGETGARWLAMGHAPCISYNCQGHQYGSALVGTDFDMDFTQGMIDTVNNNDMGAVWSIWGEEGGYKSYKPYVDMAASVVYDTPTPMAAPIEPADKQVTVSTQPTLRVNPVGDADGDTVQYYFRVSTSPDAETGAVINSGWLQTPQWTIPEGILQDGTTYYWHVYTLGATQTNPNWVRSLKVDLRTGKDSTQAYDTIGPMGIDLATGNATTSAGTHTMSALGGSIGLTLDYNTPTRSQMGLTGEYWNVSSGNTTPSGDPQLRRSDPNINFTWLNGSSPGTGVNADWFAGRWKGYFIAPTTGDYRFGASADDSFTVTVGSQSFTGCYGNTPCYNGAPIHLTAGQVVPINAQFIEATGDGYARMYVKGAVPEQVVPREWLRTEVQASATQYGLMGRYYTDDGSHTFPTTSNDPNRLMMARNDSKLSFEWGGGGPAAGLQGDNFMTRWTGYVTVPTNGNYTFGAVTDDGVRIKLDTGLSGVQQTVLDSWQPQAATLWGNATSLSAGQQIPITIDYFELGGGAHFSLLVRGPGIADQEIPAKWLTPKATALPDAWRLGVDVDGNVAYERLRVVGQNVVLEDATRTTHEYTWMGNAFKAPINEDGQLTRNTDNTYTLLDTDGRTYIFDAEGKLKSLTSPTDDKSPASLKYEYSGDPSRLMKITDGVTNSRYGTLHYKGVNEESNCSVPSGFDPAPDGMLCAFKTSDGNLTKFYYKAGQLSRIEKPGNELTDYGYDTVGRITTLRDSLANDAIAASVRADTAEVTTEVSYDSIGRVAAIKAPAATSGASRLNHTIDYLSSTKQLASPTVVSSTPVPGTLAAVSWGDQRIDVFARGSGNDLIHKATNDGVSWSAWESLGGCIRDTPSVASWKFGRLDVFARGCSDTAYNLYHRTYENGWYQWDQPGNVNQVFTGSPSVVSWSNERLDYAMRGIDGKLYHGYWQSNVGWGGLDARTTCTSGSPTIASPASGELDIYALGCDSTADKTISKYAWRSDTNSWTDSIVQPEKGVAVSAASLGDSGSILTYLKADQSAYARFGDTTRKVGDCLVEAPVAVVKSVPKLLYSNCSSTDIQQAPLLPGGGATQLHITGASEPNGFSKRIEYDSLLRATKEVDLANLATTTEWDGVEDLQLSKTDATGLKSTTLYDQLDRATDNYGPAPASWFGTDRKPLAANLSQVPHTQTGYDEGITGLGLSLYNNAKLLQTPKLITTGMTNLPYGSYGIDLTNTTVPPTDGLSARATGKIRLDKTGVYSFKIWHSDGARVYIDSQLISNDWADGTERFSPVGTYNNVTAGKYVTLTIEFYKKGASGAGVNGRLFASLNQLEPGSGTWTEAIGNEYTPGYNLATSQTAFDADLGNVTTKTNYSNPAYGTASSTVLDPTGLNYSAQATYEAPGQGFLRQTSKTLPGGSTTTYQHYGAEETRDNPCTAPVEALHQAGRPKGKTEADPDGAGPQTARASETIYDESGNVVATHYNDDLWTCTEYDSRGRVTRTVVPALGDKPGRTMTNNYAKDGNPLVSTTTDDQGTIQVENDLLGRTLKYTDAHGSQTVNTYDGFGKVTRRVSLLGSETYEYDNYDRLATYKLDGVPFATITYDQYGRIQNAQYPDGLSLEPAQRDVLGRVNKVTYKAGSQYITDETQHSVSGLVLSGTENGMAKSYSYDKALRLTGATIGSDTFAYQFGAQDSSCTVPSGYEAGKNSNRTRLVKNGQVTTYCYNNADQLVTSSDARFQSIAYDSHGNTTSMGDPTHRTQFAYDVSDRNISIEESGGASAKKVEYKRDVGGRIIERVSKNNGNTLSDEKQVYTSPGSTPSVLLDQNDTIVYKYLSLPGGVSLRINPSSTSAGAKTYSLANSHGDIMATVDADGLVTGTFVTGPFGEQLSHASSPQNATADTSYGYVGNSQNFTESSFAVPLMQMGARVYIPELGRFLQVDPVEGGTLNNYVYAMDPINQCDLNGQFVFLVLVIVGLAVAAAVTIASASKNLQANPSSAANWVSMGAAVAGVGAGTGAGAATSAASKAAPQAAKSASRSVSSVKPSIPPTPRQVQESAIPPAQVHGNSLQSPLSTWGYKLYSNDGTFLKNGITSKDIPQKRYTNAFMSDKYMVTDLFPNRYEAYQWEYEQNLTMRGPLNKNMH